MTTLVTLFVVLPMKSFAKNNCKVSGSNGKIYAENCDKIANGKYLVRFCNRKDPCFVDKIEEWTSNCSNTTTRPGATEAYRVSFPIDEKGFYMTDWNLNTEEFNHIFKDSAKGACGPETKKIVQKYVSSSKPPKTNMGYVDLSNKNLDPNEFVRGSSQRALKACFSGGTIFSERGYKFLTIKSSEGLLSFYDMTNLQPIEAEKLYKNCF